MENNAWFWDTKIVARSQAAGLTIVLIPCLFLRRFDKESTLDAIPDTIQYFRSLMRFRAVYKDLIRS